MSIKRILKYSEEQNWGETKTLFLSTPEGILNHREIISKRKTFGSSDPLGSPEGVAFEIFVRLNRW